MDHSAFAAHRFRMNKGGNAGNFRTDVFANLFIPLFIIMHTGWKAVHENVSIGCQKPVAELGFKTIDDTQYDDHGRNPDPYTDDRECRDP